MTRSEHILCLLISCSDNYLSMARHSDAYSDTTEELNDENDNEDRNEEEENNQSEDYGVSNQ